MSEGTLFVKDSRTSKEYEIPITRNSVKAADFKKIVGPAEGTNPADHVAKGLRLFDPGVQHTATHESKITWVDGNKGVLLFRGHNFQQLWDNDFEDMLHLMVWETLPTPEQKESLRKEIAEVSYNVADSVAQTIRSFPQNGPAVPMALAGLAAYAAANPDILPAYNAGTTLHRNPEAIRSAIVKAVGAYITVIAIADCHRKGIKFTSPSLDKTVYENLLIMLGRVDADGNPDTLLLNSYRHSGAMGADHEITNSTFALLVAASSLGDPVSSLISAISTCYGPLHMGACESAFKSMQKVGSVENARLLIESVKRGERRLYGYGHRMYRTVDPRIARVRGIVKDLGNDSHPVLPIAMEIDRLASTDEYFVKRDLHANVDLFVVFVGIGLGWHADFVPLFIVLLRLPGYMAHWNEAMHRDIKLMRPAGFYTGPTEAVDDEPAVTTETTFAAPETPAAIPETAVPVPAAAAPAAVEPTAVPAN
ncbi:hypothetical protein UA08_08749 [Talaromyces atroroseus]|uniref:Citrate synthase n=1 Tax=Talaromyces atroroseus TaxID=1441469 RepID=A0A225AKB0_TALAT|nr:hypothetical protein UA08_08749 [Talaromyces atroroseus]OKL55969.1 hypothetical protein UA08_08749 [Talaromyces atroroseus]